MSNQKKIYFASDFHLGDNPVSSKIREREIVRWLDQIQSDAEAIYLVGDIFDYWFEFKEVVPRGNIRFFGKLAELVDKGIEIHIFTGNHDVWMFGYLSEEIGVIIHNEPIDIILRERRFFIGHGDGLGPGDYGYKILKKIFRNKIAQWLFARLHPNFSLLLMKFFSNLGKEDSSDYQFMGIEKEWLTQYSMEKLKTDKIDFFIFGHRHIDINVELPNSDSRFINLGEWMHRKSYAVYDGDTVELKYFS